MIGGLITRAIVILVVITLFASAQAAAQSTRPEIQAYRLAEGESIVVDGAPDEAVWQKANPATNFLQRDPDNGTPATEQTEVRILLDRDRIILGVICFDSESDKLLGNQMQRDQSFESDDRFMFAIDPFLDGRTGYFFEINPSSSARTRRACGPAGCAMKASRACRMPAASAASATSRRASVST
jgi:hypothetical protein